TDYQAVVLTLGSGAFAGASPVEVFVGVGGEVTDNPGGTATPLNYADDQIDVEGGVGFHATLNNLSLVTLKNNNGTPTVTTDDKSYLGLDLSGLSAELLGIDGLTLGVYGAGVKVNQAKDTDNNVATNPAKLDWTTFFDNTAGMTVDPASIPDVGAGVDIQAQGSLILNVFGVVLVKGSFKLQLGTVTELGADHQAGGTGADKDTDYQAVVLTLGSGAFAGASPVEVFVGVGGEVTDNPGGTATPLNYGDDQIDVEGGVGFHATLNNLSLVTLKNNNGTPTVRTDDKSYLGLDLSGLSAELLGIDGLTLGVYGAGVKVNQAKDTDNNVATNPAKLDWTTFFDNTAGMTVDPASIPDVGAGVDIQAQGSLILNAFGVVLVKGSFKLQLGTVTELGADHQAGGTGADKDTDYQAVVLTLGSGAFAGASPVEVFVGVGGEVTDNPGGTATPLNYGDDQIDVEGGVGFHATLNNLSLVTLKNNNGTPTVRTDDKSYLGLDLSGLSAELLGIDGLTLGVYGAGVKVNQAKDTDNNVATNPAKLDWTTFFDNTAGMTVDPASIPDVGAGVDIQAQGSLILNAFGVVLVKGSFKLQLGTVTELGADHQAGGTGADKDTDYQAVVLTLGSGAFAGASPVEVFVGVGGEVTDNPGGTATPLNYGDDQIDVEGGVGFHATLNNLSLVTLKNNNGTPTVRTDDKSYLGLDLSGLSAELLGIDGLTLGVYGAGVKVNQAKDTDNNVATNPAKLDWTTFFDNTAGMTVDPASIPDVGAGVDIQAQGSLILNAFGVVLVKGSFKLQLGTVTELGADHQAGGTGADKDTDYQAVVLTLGSGAFAGASPVEVFVGVGGEVTDNPGGTATPLNYGDDQIDVEGGVGFHATLNNLSLVTLKNNNGTPTVRTDDKSYLGLDLSGLSAELLGIDGLTLGVYGAGVKVNQAKDTDNNVATNPAKLDWTTFFDNTAGMTVDPASIPDVGAGVDIQAQGSLILNAFGVVLVKGSFKLQLGTVTELGADHQAGGTGADKDTDYQAVVLTLGSGAFAGASPVEVFVGVGGEVTDNPGGTATPLNYGDDQIDVEGGVGFHATLNNLSLVTLKNNNGTPTVRTDDKSYLGLDLSGLSAELLGIDGLTLGVYGAGVKVNQAKDTDNNVATNPAKLDWTTFFDNTAGMTVDPASIPDVGAGVDIQAQGSLILNAFGVVLVKGSFKLQLGTVTELGADQQAGGTGADKDTDYQAVVLTLGSGAFGGASAVEIFVGVGGEVTDNPGGTATPLNYADDQINVEGGVGFHATLNNLSLVTLKNNNGTPTVRTDDKSY